MVSTEAGQGNPRLAGPRQWSRLNTISLCKSIDAHNAKKACGERTYLAAEGEGHAGGVKVMKMILMEHAARHRTPVCNGRTICDSEATGAGASL